MNKVCIGIDASKNHLDVAVDGVEGVPRHENTPAGHQELIEYLGQ